MYYRRSGRGRPQSTIKLILSLISIIIVLLLIVLLVRMNLRARHQRIVLEQRVGNLQAQVESLEKEKDKLIGQIEETHDADYLERVGKEELNLQKPGEKVISFLSLDDASIIEEEEPIEPGFWGKLFARFKSLFN